MNLKPIKGSDELINKLKPGKGWDYNPGKTALEFDTTFGGNFKLNDAQPDYKDFARPSVKDVEIVTEASQLPFIKEFGEEKFLELLKKEFDLTDSDYSTIKTADDDIT